MISIKTVPNYVISCILCLFVLSCQNNSSDYVVYGGLNVPFVKHFLDDDKIVIYNYGVIDTVSRISNLVSVNQYNIVSQTYDSLQLLMYGEPNHLHRFDSWNQKVLWDTFKISYVEKSFYSEIIVDLNGFIYKKTNLGGDSDPFSYLVNGDKLSSSCNKSLLADIDRISTRNMVIYNYPQSNQFGHWEISKKYKGSIVYNGYGHEIPVIYEGIYCLFKRQ